MNLMAKEASFKSADENNLYPTLRLNCAGVYRVAYDKHIGISSATLQRHRNTGTFNFFDYPIEK